MTRAHANPGGDVRSPHASVFTLDVMKRRGYDAVEAGTGESLQQKRLEHVDAPFGCWLVQWLSDEIAKRRRHLP